MNTKSPFSRCLTTSLLALFALFQGLAQEPVGEGALDVVRMTSVPEGKYAVALQIQGQTIETEFLIEDSQAECTKSGNASGKHQIKGAAGKFEHIGHGVFMIRVRGDGYNANQFWIFNSDGTAKIKGIPDRGEEQNAMPLTLKEPGRAAKPEPAKRGERPTIADGRYEVTVEVGGNLVKNEFAIRNGTVECVKSDEEDSDDSLLGATGTFVPLESDIEAFRIPLRLKNTFRSQIWIFLTDGSAIIKEIPDRGEQGKAVPIKSQ